MLKQKKNLDSQVRLQAIIDTASDGIITIDEKGIVETLNKSAAKMFCYSPEEVIGHNISMLMKEPHHSNHDQYLKNYRDTGKKQIIGIGREVLGRRKDGTTFPFRLSVAEVILADNKRIFTGIIHDTSDKALAQSIQLALEKEQKLNELKSRFVSIASHEFRTPLTSILSSATLIGKYKDEESDYKRMKHVQRIRTSVKNLTNILDDFLSLSKLEEGKTAHYPLHFNLKNVATELTEEMQAIAKTNQQIVYRHFGDSEQVFLDKKKLFNILINLISNAIKYSNENQRIEFTTKITTEKVFIIVQDYGIGIPEEAKKTLFERFFRADNVTNLQGTGLGLNIVKRYLELMNGVIDFESELGNGSTFTVCFDKKAATEDNNLSEKV